MVYHLDTNIVVAIFSGQLKASQHTLPTDEIALSAVVLGELRFGAERSTKRQQNISKLNAFASNLRIVSADRQTAEFFGHVKASLLAKGRPIPENDIWIAAQALQHDAILVTRDHHFSHVDQLSTASW